ncbi:MAG: hypothetical protein ACE5RN_05345 [Nitrosopumilaceae archaeon]
MKSRKTLLIIFFVITSVIGFATLQDYILDENQLVEVNETSPSTEKTIIVGITDGVGLGQRG